jgi:hypothetical protein
MPGLEASLILKSSRITLSGMSIIAGIFAIAQCESTF